MMAAAALVVFLLFLLIAFAARSWIHYRRTGDHGIRLRASGPVARLAALLLLAGIALGGLAPTVELLGIARPFAALDVAWLRGIGLAFSIVSMVVIVVAQSQMGAAWRVGVDPRERTTLATHGVFGVVRNPIFTAVMIATAGLALTVPNPVSIAAVVCVLLGLEIQVRWIEEPYLSRIHGTSYRSYARSVGRFLPGIGRLR